MLGGSRSFVFLHGGGCSLRDFLILPVFFRSCCFSGGFACSNTVQGLGGDQNGFAVSHQIDFREMPDIVRIAFVEKNKEKLTKRSMAGCLCLTELKDKKRR